MSTRRRERVEKGVYRRSGKYEICWRDSTGRLRWKQIPGGIRTARAALAVEHARRARGERVLDTRLPFTEAADCWWESRALNVRASTQEAYRYHLDKLRDHFGRTRLSAIGPAEVAAFLAKERRSGAGAATLNGRLVVLSGVFSYAIRYLDHAGANPVKLLGPEERPRRDSGDSKRALSDEEVAGIIAATPDREKLLVRTLVETGARRSEISGLVWDDIDLREATLTISQQLHRVHPVRVALKTRNSHRTIVLTQQLAAQLKKHYMASGRPDGDSYVFRRINGKPYQGSQVGEVVKRAAKAAGLTGVTAHRFRHTHISKLVGSGWDVVEVAARAGDTVTTLQRTYLHEWEAARRSKDQRDRLGSLYGGGAGNGRVTAERGAARQTATGSS